MFDTKFILDRAEPMCAKPAKIVMAMPRYRYQSIADLRLHPLIAKLVDKDALEKMGAKRTEGEG